MSAGFVPDPGRAYTRLRTERPDLFERPLQAGAVRLVLGEPQGPDGAGLFYADRHVLVLRDAVVFPSGAPGTYVRVVPATPADGAAVLPTVNRLIVLIRHYRHATGEWHWEIPRGFGDTTDATPRETARRELREELGVEALDLTLVGQLHPDTGLLGGLVHLFHASVPRTGVLDAEEAITGYRAVAATELEDMIARGELTDSFTLAAYTAARTAGLLSLDGV